jgi:hypothetical protein
MKLKHLGKGWEPRIRAHSYQLRLSSETSNPATSWGSRSRRRNDGWYAYFEIFILKNAKIGISMPWAFIYIELAAQTKYLIRKLHHKTQYRPNSPHLRQNLSYSQPFETCKHLLLHLTYFTHNPWEFWKVEISSDFICFNPIDLTMKWCLIFSYLFKTLIGFLGKLTQFNQFYFLET